MRTWWAPTAARDSAANGGSPGAKRARGLAEVLERMAPCDRAIYSVAQLLALITTRVCVFVRVLSSSLSGLHCSLALG